MMRPDHSEICEEKDLKYNSRLNIEPTERS